MTLRWPLPFKQVLGEYKHVLVKAEYKDILFTWP